MGGEGEGEGEGDFERETHFGWPSQQNCNESTTHGFKNPVNVTALYLPLTMTCCSN